MERFICRSCMLWAGHVWWAHLHKSISIFNIVEWWTRCYYLEQCYKSRMEIYCTKNIHLKQHINFEHQWHTWSWMKAHQRVITQMFGDATMLIKHNTLTCYSINSSCLTIWKLKVIFKHVENSELTWVENVQTIH